MISVSLDSAAHLTFSKPMGFIEKGADISNLIRNMEKGLDYFAVVCHPYPRAFGSN